MLFRKRNDTQVGGTVQNVTDDLSRTAVFKIDPRGGKSLHKFAEFRRQVVKPDTIIGGDLYPRADRTGRAGHFILELVKTCQDTLALPVKGLPGRRHAQLVSAVLTVKELFRKLT